jgi:hypothetical protein
LIDACKVSVKDVPSSVTSETLPGVSPSSRRRPSTLTMTSERRSPSEIAVSTVTAWPARTPRRVPPQQPGGQRQQADHQERDEQRAAARHHRLGANVTAGSTSNPKRLSELHAGTASPG